MLSNLLADGLLLDVHSKCYRHALALPIVHYGDVTSVYCLRHRIKKINKNSWFVVTVAGPRQTARLTAHPGQCT